MNSSIEELALPQASLAGVERVPLSTKTVNRIFYSNLKLFFL